MAKVLILHGWTNRRQPGHWQRHLANELRKQGHIVAYPQFPNTDQPKLGEWQELLAAELDILAEIEDGETIVIGGVFSNTQSKVVDKVPFLGDVPYLGRLFRRDVVAEKKSELLVFLTPRIMNNQAIAVSR